MREWWNKFRAWAGGRRGVAEDLAEELQTHLEMEMESRLEHGMSPQEARARFGNRTLIAGRARDAWGFPSVESLWRDVRYGLRAMRRSPGFALVVILTFALGVGVNTAIFSVVHEVLLKPLPYPHGERVVRFGESTARSRGISVTWVNFKNWRDNNHTFDEMAGVQFTARTLTGRADPVTTSGLTITSPYFALLGMHPLLGRLFDDADDRPASAPGDRIESSLLGRASSAAILTLWAPPSHSTAARSKWWAWPRPCGNRGKSITTFLWAGSSAT